MKGYKIGINKDTLEFVLIELEIPNDYPGKIVYGYLQDMVYSPLLGVPYIQYYKVTQYRTNVARVLDIRKIKDGIVEHVESAISLYDPTFYYRSGEIVYPKAFELDAEFICTDGIHFFENVEDAIKYTEDSWANYRRNIIKLDVNSEKWNEYLNIKYPTVEYIKADAK